eukprot:6710592-Pyramimonas_sp.AAC.1
MQEAQEKLTKKREQLEVAKAKESELKVQDVSIKGKGFLTAMQKQCEGPSKVAASAIRSTSMCSQHSPGCRT